MQRRMTKLLGLLLCISFVFPGIIGASTPGQTTITINGQALTTDVPPQIIQGRVLVPLRAIFEALAVDVIWDAKTQLITAKRGATTIRD